MEKTEKYYLFIYFFHLDINTVLSILPCEVLTRFDKSLISLPVIHIAITSQDKLFKTKLLSLDLTDVWFCNDR